MLPGQQELSLLKMKGKKLGTTATSSMPQFTLFFTYSVIEGYKERITYILNLQHALFAFYR